MTPFERARLAAGFTKTLLAQKLHVTEGAVRKWELGVGRPHAKLFPRIARLFKMEPEQVTYLFDQPQPATAA